MTNNTIVSSILTVKASENLNLLQDLNTDQAKSIGECLYEQEILNEEEKKDIQQKD